MRTIFVLFFALSLSVFGAKRASDFTEALELAKSGGADIAVLFHGSEWCLPGRPLAELWETQKFADGFGDDVVLVAIDAKEHPDESEQALAKRNEACPVGPRSYPAVMLFDREGRLVARRDGVVEIKMMGALGPAIQRAIEVRSRRDALWAKADASAGDQAAKFYGEGLDLMALGLGPKNIYKPVLDQLKAADPENQSGYAARYEFPGMGLVSQATKWAGEKKFEEADAEISRWLNERRLTPDQRQIAWSARFALYQRWPERKEKVPEVLKQLERVDPDSDMGKAAVEYLKILEK